MIGRFTKDIINIKLLDRSSFSLFICNQVAQFSVLFILALSFVLSYFISIISGVLLFLSFTLGVLAFNALWASKSIDFLPFFDIPNYPTKLLIQPSTGCNVCGERLCKRQKDVKDNHPWIGLNIPREIDQAIQDLFNKILNEFVTSWHSNFTKDESFILELRRCLRYASSILLKRLLQVDIGEVITDQLITTGLKHVNDYLYIVKLSETEKISIEAAAVKYLNKRLHPAVHTRKSELQYLRCLSNLLSNFLVQRPQLKCLSFRVLLRELLAGWVFLPLTDTLCDPFCINSLFLLALSHEPLTEYQNNSSLPVPFLQRFVIPTKDFASRKSALQSGLSSILKDQKLLYAFMQFLKKEGVVHILQFCLDIEEFIKKILNPELSQTEMDNLHKEAWDLFSVYFKNDSPDNVHFPKHITMQIEQVLDSGGSNISRLRTNPALFKSYEIAYAMLEENYCPLFYLSDDFFSLLCGESPTTKFTKTFSSPLQPGSPIKGRSKKSSELSTVNKLSSKFHKLLQFQAVEGKAFFNDTLEISETECAEVLQVEMQPENTYRDLSTWHVTVPSVATKQDSNSKPYPVFNINVLDNGAKEMMGQSVKLNWNVERRYNDFYILQAKLFEFHGEFEDGTQLPPKTGMFSPRGSEFLESRRQLFEEYLQKLLQKPSLRGSDLLYFFLHSPVEFSSCLSAQDRIGKIIRRSVEPIKLRKERGQHLENFLSVFLASTEGTKRAGKYEWQDISVEPVRKKRDITRSIFCNNFGPFLDQTSVSEDLPKEELVLLGPWDCVLYTISKLMGASSRVLQLTVTFRNVLGQSSDLIIKRLIKKKLESLLVPARVSHLVRLLQDSLFNSTYQPGKQGHKILKNRLISEAEKTINHNLLFRWVFPNCTQGVENIVNSLQHPILNKHLCYCLLDEVVRILFPELATST